jgi:HD superfamily phosphodiesterase
VRVVTEHSPLACIVIRIANQKDKMKTGAGRRRAEQRHAFMQEFVSRFQQEWVGAQ